MPRGGRLGRSGVSLRPFRQEPAAACQCAGRIRRARIHFVSLYEGVDTSTPNGRLVLGIFASIAEFERELIGGRVRRGSPRHVRGGKGLEGPPSLWTPSGLPRCALRRLVACDWRTDGTLPRDSSEAFELGKQTCSKTRGGEAANSLNRR